MYLINFTVAPTSSSAASTDGETETTKTAASDRPTLADYGSGTIKIWVADKVVDFTQARCDEFFKANPDMAGYTVEIQATGEGDAAGNMVTDVQAGADIFGFAQDQLALDVKNLIYGDRLKDISFQVKKGEIVGIGGLAHCGMHSLGKVCFGALKPESGSVSVSDGTIIDSPSKAMKKRLGYVSKDRDVESLCLNASIEDNISIAGMSEFAIKDFLVLKNREKKYVDNQIKELSIKCAGREQSVSQLSGGNKQKVVFGKWIGCGSEIIILDCPTRGVDIGVKQAMYQLMVKLKNEGKSILMISEELPELIGMSDRGSS